MAFKKFGKDEISGFTQVKASVARGIRCECVLSLQPQSLATPPVFPAPELVLPSFALQHRHKEFVGRLFVAPDVADTTVNSPAFALACFVVNPAASVAEQYPWLSEHGVLDLLLPKKEPLFVAKT